MHFVEGSDVTRITCVAGTDIAVILSILFVKITWFDSRPVHTEISANFSSYLFKRCIIPQPTNASYQFPPNS
jgi:hypothetical protein